MPQVTFIALDGTCTLIDAPPGISLMMAAITYGVDGIEAECGGALACGTCHVHVAALPALPAITEAEENLLSALRGGRRPDSRLSCQILLTGQLDGLVVRIPAEQG